jgi:uncharacterized protein (TIGR02284 family)
MASREHDLDTLNDLIAMTLDSAHGYDDAQKDAKNQHFKTLFGRRAIERKQVTAELQTEVRRLLGDRPAQSGTAAGKAHRVFMNLAHALTGSDEGVIKAVEAGEDRLKARYEEALADEELSAPVLDLVSRAFVSVKAGHDEMRDLKHHVAH